MTKLDECIHGSSIVSVMNSSVYDLCMLCINTSIMSSRNAVSKRRVSVCCECSMKVLT